MNKPDSLTNSYQFGKIFTDHMFQVDWNAYTGGWGRPMILPYGNIRLPTSATCFHYGISAYEGFSVVKN